MTTCSPTLFQVNTEQIVLHTWHSQNSTSKCQITHVRLLCVLPECLRWSDEATPFFFFHAMLALLLGLPSAHALTGGPVPKVLLTIRQQRLCMLQITIPTRQNCSFRHPN